MGKSILLFLLLYLLLHLLAPASEHVLVHLLLALFVLYAQGVISEGNKGVRQGFEVVWDLVHF